MYQDGQPSFHSLKFSSSNQIIFGASYDNVIRSYKFNSHIELSKLWNMEGHKSMVNAMEIMKDSYYLISADDTCEIRCWDIRTLNCV